MQFLKALALPLAACSFCYLSPVAIAAETWESEKLGNIFDAGQPAILNYQGEGDSVVWKVTDFWQKEIESGTEKMTDGKAIIRPRVTAIGYYILEAEPQKAGSSLPKTYTSFAIVQPHASKDPLKSPFGVMTHFAQGMNPEMLPLFKKIGIESIRDEHYWAHVEKNKGVYEFGERSNAYMEACKNAGIMPLIAMTFGNPMYDHKDGPTTQTGYEGYGNYGQAILNQYGKEIHWLEIWNEYNGTWCPPDARKDRSKYYAEMLKVAYEKIKAVRPDVQVLGGAAVLIPLPYFEGIFKQGGIKHMDGVVIHPYRQKPEGVEKEVAELKSLIRQYNDGKDMPIWVTETGRHTKDEYDWEKGRKMYEKGRAEGARYLARQYTLLLSEKVEKIYWYLASDHASFVSMGLLRHHSKEDSGMGRYAVAPGYVAYAGLIQQLDGASYVKREAQRDYTRTHVHHFQKGSNDVRVCWATQPSKIKVKAAAPLKVFNLMGTESTVTPVNGEAIFDLDEDVIYIEGKISEVSEIDTGVRVLAASGDDYTKTQGENNWYYGYLEGGTFKELKQVETMWGYNWGGITKNLVISPGSMHPDKLNGQDIPAVLRWKSPVDGKLTVQGYWANGDKGDGVIASILVDGKEVSTENVGGKNPGRVEINLPIEVRKGSFVDFVCAAGAGTAFDATSREFMIVQGK